MLGQGKCAGRAGGVAELPICVPLRIGWSPSGIMVPHGCASGLASTLPRRCGTQKRLRPMLNGWARGSPTTRPLHAKARVGKLSSGRRGKIGMHKLQARALTRPRSSSASQRKGCSSRRRAVGRLRLLQFGGLQVGSHSRLDLAHHSLQANTPCCAPAPASVRSCSPFRFRPHHRRPPPLMRPPRPRKARAPCAHTNARSSREDARTLGQIQSSRTAPQSFRGDSRRNTIAEKEE